MSSNNPHYKTTQVKLAKVNRVIAAAIASPNRLHERSLLWFKLQELKQKLERRLINIEAAEQADRVLNPENYDDYGG